MPQYKLYIVFIWFIFWAACSDGPRTIQLTVEAKNHLGEPVQGAQVFLDQHFIGETDGRGLLKVDQAKKLNTQVKVDIKKSSQLSYFSEFHHRVLLVTDLPAPEPVPVLVQGTLFFVPKGNQESKPIDRIVEDKSLSEHKSPIPHEAPISEQPHTPVEKPLELDALSADLDLLTDEQKTHHEIDVDESNDQAVEKSDFSRSVSLETKPSERRTDEGPILVTVHLSTKKKSVGKSTADQLPLKDVKVSLYIRYQPAPLAECFSNEFGRCVLALKKTPEEPALVVARKQGYLTGSQKVAIKSKTLTRMTLQAGHSVDMFTYQKIYQRFEPWSGLSVAANGRPLGQTNEYGFFTGPWPVTKHDLTKVSATKPGDPNVAFETTFTGLLAAPLVKYLPPKSLPLPRVVLAETLISGYPVDNELADSQDLTTLKGQIDRQIRKQLGQVFFKGQSFQEYPLSLLQKRLAEHGMGAHQLLTSRDGFDSLGLERLIDGIALVELRPQNPADNDGSSGWEIEVKIVDPRGTVLSGALSVTPPTRSGRRPNSSATRQLESLIEQDFSAVGQRVLASFPFQETTKSVASGHQISPVVFRIYDGGKIKHRAIEQAHLFVDGIWSGASDSKGTLVWSPKANSQEAQEIAFTSTGFKTSTMSVRELKTNAPTLFTAAAKTPQPTPSTDPTEKAAVRIELEPSVVMVSIDSLPKGALVSLNGTPFGRTPVEAFAPIDDFRGGLSVVIQGGSGYKTYTKHLAHLAGPLLWRGPAAITLETDELAKGDRLVLAGYPHEAVKVFSKLSPAHSDYVLAQSRAGDLMLNVLNQPAQAMMAYQRALDHPDAKDPTKPHTLMLRVHWATAALEGLQKGELPPEGGGPQVTAELALVHIGTTLALIPNTRFTTEVEQHLWQHRAHFNRALALHLVAIRTDRSLDRFHAAKAWRSLLRQPATSLSDDTSVQQNLAKAQKMLMQLTKISVIPGNLNGDADLPL